MREGTGLESEHSECPCVVYSSVEVGLEPMSQTP